MGRFSQFLNRHKPGERESQTTPAAPNTVPDIQTSAAQQPLQPPPGGPTVSEASAAESVPEPPGPGLTLALQNRSLSGNVYASISGLAIDKNNQWFLLQSDARTAYYPTNPPSIMSPLQANCAIPLGPPGNTVKVKIPHIAGGRIWFSIDKPLTFHLNPGPALVEPSVTNPSDPNVDTEWGFCEFTWNHDQLYANISYVDFVGLPIGLQLDTVNSGTRYVSGMGPSGLRDIADGLLQQQARDHAGWDQLIVKKKGTDEPLRVLSPNQGMVGNPNLFANYFEPYINQAYEKFASQQMKLDTQAGFGNVSGRVQANTLALGGSSFVKPTTRDIFTCDSGPFRTGQNQETNAIIPRLAAAFNRSTLLATDQFPADRSLYYQHGVTNHYSRVVHEHNLDGKGYAFPYDDVQPSGGADQSGEVHAGDPKLFTIMVGGQGAKAR